MDDVSRIPILRGHCNFHEWDRMIKSYAMRGHAYSNLLGRSKEPHRRIPNFEDAEDVKACRPTGEYAGMEYPVGEAASGPDTFDIKEDWERWAKKEVYVRHALLSTTHEHYLEYMQLWSAHDIYALMKEWYDIGNVEDQRHRLACMHIKMPRKPKSLGQAMERHIKTFRTHHYKYTLAGGSMSDSVLCLIFLDSLQPDLRLQIYDSWVLRTPRDWDNLLNVFFQRTSLQKVWEMRYPS